jgi:diguanylate cyclase (GGDEF)-like protein
MTALDQAHRHVMILHFTRLSILVIIAGTFLRPLLVELPTEFTLIGIANIIVACLGYLLIRSARFPKWELIVFIALGFITIIPLVLMSGGVNSQFTYLLPIFPLVSALLGGTKPAWVTFVLLTVTVLGLMMGGAAIPDFTGAPYVPDKSFLRGFWLLMSVGAGTYFGIFFQRRNLQLTQKLDDMATRDHLTKLLNRRGLSAQLVIELRRAQRSGKALSLLVLDIDHFKSINDEYGHDEGDRCLKSVADCLQSNTRIEDLVARFGGEEFVVVLVDTAAREAALAAEKLRRKVAELYLVGLNRSVTVTIGLVTAAATGEYDEGDLIKQADQALYNGKRNGRNRVEVAG